LTEQAGQTQQARQAEQAEQADCIFCQIERGDAPCALVYRDDQVLAFMDIQPVTRGHTLIVTRQHFENLYEVSEQALSAVASVSRRLAPAIREVIAPEGLRVFQLNGAAAGQTVFHYHMHLIPRTAGEPDRFHGRVMADPAELAAVAVELQAALQRKASQPA
jgi:histidine triad (HIT) family protein